MMRRTMVQVVPELLVSKSSNSSLVVAKELPSAALWNSSRPSSSTTLSAGGAIFEDLPELALLVGDLRLPLLGAR